MENIFAKKDNYKAFQHIKSHLKLGRADGCPNPLVSVIMPVFKRPDTFALSLKSVIKQECDFPYEIVVVDNYDGEGESPNFEVVKQFVTTNLLYYQNEKNLGMMGNWNRGIELARADYITFCHDDDLLLPCCIDRLMKIQKKVGNKLILSKWNSIDENGDVIPQFKRFHFLDSILPSKDFYEYSLYDQFISSMGFGVGCLFNKKILQDIGGYNADYYPSSDYALHAAYTYYYGCVINNQVVFNYRKSRNESMNVYIKFPEINKEIRSQIVQKLKYPHVLLERIRMAIYRLSSINFAIEWGGKEKSLEKKKLFTDRLVYFFASFPTKAKQYSFFF